MDPLNIWGKLEGTVPTGLEHGCEDYYVSPKILEKFDVPAKTLNLSQAIAKFNWSAILGINFVMVITFSHQIWKFYMQLKIWFRANFNGIKIQTIKRWKKVEKIRLNTKDFLCTPYWILIILTGCSYAPLLLSALLFWSSKLSSIIRNG